jgi:hypothetical protein
MVGNDERWPFCRHVLHAKGRNSPVMVVESHRKGMENLVGQFGVVTEVIDFVITLKPSPQETSELAHLLLEDRLWGTSFGRLRSVETGRAGMDRAEAALVNRVVPATSAC